MEEAKLSEKEAQNSLKVKKMLLEIPGLAVKTLREDLFLVTEPETEVSFVVDVEEEVLFLRAEVQKLPADPNDKLYRFLLEQNPKILHVAFGIDEDTVVLTGNLEIENLDVNELEASCKSLILSLYQASDTLSELLTSS